MEEFQREIAANWEGRKQWEGCEATKGDDCRVTWVGATPANIMDKMAITLLGGNAGRKNLVRVWHPGQFA